MKAGSLAKVMGPHDPLQIFNAPQKVTLWDDEHLRYNNGHHPERYVLEGELVLVIENRVVEVHGYKNHMARILTQQGVGWISHYGLSEVQ